MTNEIALKMENISKEFPGVKALNNVNLSVKKGEIHALCGENGAGKSTLMKILGGVYPYKSYTGDIVIDGRIARFTHVKDSEEAGIAVVYQELALAPDLEVAENIYLGNLTNSLGIVDWGHVRQKSQELLARLGLSIPLDKKVRELGIGQQQLLEIAKALALNKHILVLDEPTAALTEVEVELLLKVLRNLRDMGVTCILITHKLNEIFAVADSITILRDGASIDSHSVGEITENEIVHSMVGRKLEQLYPHKHYRVSNKIALEVRDYSLYENSYNSNKILDKINLKLYKNEILGLAGLIGAGRTELLSSLFGFMDGKTRGSIRINGKDTYINNINDAIKNGLGMVTEDRKLLGLILGASVSENISLASMSKFSSYGIIQDDQEITETSKYASDLRVKTPSMETTIKNLSGGNQQKALLARSLMTKPSILFLDEPTRGIDIGAKHEIYNLMCSLVEQGTSIIMVSSELPEIMGMSDRIMVVSGGKITGEFLSQEATQEKIMLCASGMHT